MHVTDPLSHFHPNSTVPPQKNKSIGHLPHLFLRKAAAKENEAYELLHPDNSEPASIIASLNTGKLTKFVNYIRNGFPVLLIIYTSSSQLF